MNRLIIVRAVILYNLRINIREIEKHYKMIEKKVNVYKDNICYTKVLWIDNNKDGLYLRYIFDTVKHKFYSLEIAKAFYILNIINKDYE